MADLIIRGMAMPESCFDCPIFDNFCQERCGITGTPMYGEIDPHMETLPDCPLVPLPEGHGDLIDLDALRTRMYETMDYQDLYLPIHFEMCMGDAPTIVPAEGGTDE